MKIFCYRLIETNGSYRDERGPLLVTANHPNSFLDAIIIASRFRRPIHFLTRGDAFQKPWHNKALQLLNMIPIYRLSEGKEHLGLNHAAFAKSREVLLQQGIVLIFIEGICVNQHQLQPFKKGAARIALQYGQQSAPLRVLPLTLQYDSFKRFGKTVIIQAGEPVLCSRLLPYDDEAKNFLYFNEQQEKVLTALLEKKATPEKTWADGLPTLFLCVPALAGWLLHAPVFIFLKKRIRKKTSRTVFYDASLFAVLLVLYPLYLIGLTLALACLQIPVWILLVVVLAHPVTAWCAVQWYRSAA